MKPYVETAVRTTTLRQRRIFPILGVLACALLAFRCETDDDGGWIYVAAGSVDDGVTLSLVLAPPFRTLRTITAPAGHRHLAFVRDEGADRLIWVHGENGDWAAEILTPDLRRITVRQDTAILAGDPAGRYIHPTGNPWPGTLTESGLLVMGARVPPVQPSDTLVRGLLVLSAADLSFGGLVPGTFNGIEIVPSGRSCCVVAFGSRDASQARLYELDAAANAFTDSFDITPRPYAVKLPGTRRIARQGAGTVEIYDLDSRQSVASRDVGVDGPLAFNVGLGLLLVAGRTEVFALDPMTLSEVWRVTLVPNGLPEELGTVAVTAEGKVLVGGTGRPFPIISQEGSLVAIRLPPAGPPARTPFPGPPRVFGW